MLDDESEEFEGEQPGGPQAPAGQPPTLMERVEELGQLQFSVEEVERILEVSHLAKMEIEAYNRGRLMAEATVRKALLISAKSGSNPAQQEYLKLIHECKRRNGG